MSRDVHSRTSRPIEGLLRRASARTRALDVGRGVMIVVNFVLLVLLVLILYDHTLKLPVVLRLIGHIAVTYATGVLLVVLVVIPALRRLSARYIALEIERTQKGFHHTLVSYMEARGDPAVPEEIVSALAQRASEDAQTVVLDKAIDERPFLRTSIVLIAVLLVFFAFSMLTDKPVYVSVRRILHPFGDIPAPSRVRLLEISPGDAEVTRGKPFRISVRTGKVIPDSVRVRMSATGSEWSVLPLEADDVSPRKWSGVIPSIDKDFRYQITAGDAESREFRVLSFPAPIIEQLMLVYDYPPYTGIEARRSVEGDIVAPAGTRVAMEVSCSNALARAWLEINGEDMSLARTKRDDKLAMGSITVTENGKYSIHVRDTRGARNDPVSYRIEAQQDRAPEVAIENPSEEVRVVRELSTVEVAVAASDDYGVAEVSFYYRVNGGVSTVRRHESGRGERDVRVTEALDLKKHLSGYGDTVSFFAEARDAHMPEANYAKTPVYVIAYAPSRVEGKLAARDAKDPLRDRAVDEETAEEGDERERTEVASDDVDAPVEGEQADEAASSEEAEAAEKIAEALESLRERTQDDESEPTLVADASDEQAREAAGDEGDPGDRGDEEAGDRGAADEGDDREPSSSEDGEGAGDSAGESDGDQQEGGAGNTTRDDDAQNAQSGDTGEDASGDGSGDGSGEAGSSEGGQGEGDSGGQSQDGEGETGSQDGGDGEPSSGGEDSSSGDDSDGSQGGSSQGDGSSESSDSQDSSSQGEGGSSGGQGKGQGDQDGSSGGQGDAQEGQGGSDGSSGSSGESEQEGASSGEGEGQGQSGESGGSSGEAGSQGGSGSSQGQGSGSSQGSPSGESGSSSGGAQGQGGNDAGSGGQGEGSQSSSGSSSSGSSTSDGAQGGAGQGIGSGAGATADSGGSAGGQEKPAVDDQHPPEVARAPETAAGGDLPFVVKVAAQLQEALERGEVDAKFLEEAGMTREQLLEFAKKYEKIVRPRRDADSDSDENDQGIPDEPSPEADAKTDVVLGSGVDDKAKGMGRVDDEELSEERLKDLFDEFSENVSPEYRDVIEAYYKRLAGDESDSR